MGNIAICQSLCSANVVNSCRPFCSSTWNECSTNGPQRRNSNTGEAQLSLPFTHGEQKIRSAEGILRDQVYEKQMHEPFQLDHALVDLHSQSSSVLCEHVKICTVSLFEGFCSGVPGEKAHLENQKPTSLEKETFWASPFAMHLVCTLLSSLEKKNNLDGLLGQVRCRGLCRLNCDDTLQGRPQTAVLTPCRGVYVPLSARSTHVQDQRKTPRHTYSPKAENTANECLQTVPETLSILHCAFRCERVRFEIARFRPI